MKNYLLVVAISFVVCGVYADNILNPKTGEYYITKDDLLDNLTVQEDYEKDNRENAFDFMHSDTKNKLDINKTLTLGADVGLENITFQNESDEVATSKFYTQETKVVKKVWNDKLELYGGAVLGASYYKANNVDKSLDSGDRVATLAGSRTGAKYNVSDNVGLVVEGQYNLTGEMAGDSQVIKNFNNTEYSGSKVLKTGVEWNF